MLLICVCVVYVCIHVYKGVCIYVCTCALESTREGQKWMPDVLVTSCVLRQILLTWTQSSPIVVSLFQRSCLPPECWDIQLGFQGCALGVYLDAGGPQSGPRVASTHEASPACWSCFIFIKVTWVL